MLYEVSFNVKNHPQAVMVYLDMEDISMLSVKDLNAKIANGEYALSLQDALDNMPTDCDMAIGYLKVPEDGELKEEDRLYKFCNVGEYDEIKSVILGAFGNTQTAN